MREIRIARVHQQATTRVGGKAVGADDAVAVHIAFVLSATRQTEAWQTSEEVHRVQSLVQAGAVCGLSNFTILEEFSGPTSLSSYFQFLVQHIDNKDNLFSFNVLDEHRYDTIGDEHLQVNLISNYRGKAEVICSVRRLARTIEANEAEGRTARPAGARLEAALGKGLRAGELPEPDLMVFFDGRRNLGEAGVWIGAYSEFAFLDKPWQSFNTDDLRELLADLGLRQRRFGAV